MDLEQRDAWYTSDVAPVRTGAAPIGINLGDSWEPVQEYARRINAAVIRLDDAARAQIVYADPAVIAGTAGDYGTGVPAAVAELQARAKARGAATTKLDLAWAKQWQPFRVEWTVYNASLPEGTFSPGPGTTPATAWGRLEEYETKLRGLQTAFGALPGVTPPPELPKTLETPTGEPDESGEPSWVKPAIVAVTVIGAAWTFASFVKLARG